MSKKKIFLVCSLAVLVSALFGVTREKKKICMGVPRITEDQLRNYTETTELDISKITFEGEPVAFDWENRCVYIYQATDKQGRFSNLKGKLDVIDTNYQLFFLEDQLIIQYGEVYQKINVILTTFPVMYLDVSGSYVDSEGNNIVQGKMTLWNSLGKDSTGYQTKTSHAEWHMRGNSTRIYPKLAWKLNLKGLDGEKTNEDLLNLGSDDDWILNPMSMDDTFVKEQVSQILWNQLAETSDSLFAMSKGEYVELVINGSYQGLYMLQRRVDEKFLKLDKSKDILFKGMNTWEAENLDDGYEVIYTPYDFSETYRILECTLGFKDGNSINIDNFIDVSLFLQVLSGVDNCGYKNMFYALCEQDDAYKMYMIPWDTDLSFGVTWGYDYDESIQEMIERQELPIVRKFAPDIDERLALRWSYLRKDIFSENNILQIYEQVTKELTESGALERDFQCWGLLHDGEDNWENLQYFIKERLEILDEYYSTEKKSVN